MKFVAQRGLLIIGLASFAVGTAFADAGHGANPPGHGQTEADMADTSAFGTKGKAPTAKRTVKIKATEIQYDVSSLQFRAGETVRFVITNDGEQAHEFTIGDAKYHEMARQMMSQMADMGMDPASPEHENMHASAGNTIIVTPGQTREIVWTFTQAGTFEFSCNFLGHSEAGMKGSISIL